MHSTLSEYFRKFAREECGTRMSTRKMRQVAMDHCLRGVGDIALRDFDFDAARTLQRYLIDSPSRNAVSANAYLRMLEPVFDRARYEGELAGDENPLRLLRKLREPRKRVEVYGVQEVDAILSACRRLSNREAGRVWRTRILSAVCAAMRRSEALNLNVRDIDFERGEIWVCAKQTSERAWSWGLKDYEDRKVPCPPLLSNHLAEVVAELPAGQPYVALTRRRYQGCQRLRKLGRWSDALSVTPDMNFNKPWQRLCRAAGVPNKTFKGLRATCITWWLQEGVPVQEVKDLAGHSDIETTMKYYAAIRSDHVKRASGATQRIMGSLLGATGLEPATS